MSQRRRGPRAAARLWVASEIRRGRLVLLTTIAIFVSRLPAEAQETLQRGPVTFLFEPEQERLARALSQTLQLPIRLPGLPNDVLTSDSVLVYLTPDQEAFDSLAPNVPDWSGGIAFPEGGRIVLPAFSGRLGTEPLGTILRHELAHVALSRYLGRAVPRWFHEGYAQLAAGSWRAEDAWTLRLAMVLGEIPPLESLTLSFPRDRLSAEHAYLLSYTAVEYLYRLGGARGFEHLLSRWRDLGDLDSALRYAYGLTLGQFQAMWRKDVGRRFGWLLVLAQATAFWTALTIVLLVLGYWKIRRDRRKLARLRRLESMEEDREAEGARPPGEEPGVWPRD